MSGSSAVFELNASDEHVRRLPAPFYADQGALRVPTGEFSAALPPVELVAVVVAAADMPLHVGKPELDALRGLAHSLKELLPARRGDLLIDLLLANDPARAIDVAARGGLLVQLLPDIDRIRAMPRGGGLYKDVYAHTLRVLAATPADRITRLAALFHDVAKPDTLVVERGVAHFPNHDLLGADRAARRLSGLGFDEPTVQAVSTLVRLHLRANSYEGNWTDSAVRRLRLDAGDHWNRLLDLSHADVTSARADVVARARRRVQDLADHARALDAPVDVSPLDGNALMERFGRGPGRWIGDVKRELIGRVREGSLNADDTLAAWCAAEEIVSRLDAE